MRQSRLVPSTIALGVAVLAYSAFRGTSFSLTTLALFGAAAILTELFEESDRERSRQPVETERFRIAVAVHIAAVLVLGPWAAALVAASGVVAGSLFRGTRLRSTLFGACSLALAAAAGGVAFRTAGGHAGELRLLDNLIPLVALAIAYVTVRTLLVEVVQSRETFDPRLFASAAEAGLGAAVALLVLAHPWDVLVLVPVAIAVHQAQLRLVHLQRETLRALETFANIVDERDPSTYHHSMRVAGYVDGLARALLLPFSDIDRLRWAGRLHDLGKVAVDSSVLRKPGRLDGAEWASMRRHPRLSARLLQRFEFIAAQARAVELHHERVDGAGYYGVGGDDLPLASHFLIVADSFDAMQTDRPYRPGLSLDAALIEIERNLGTQFHPVVGKAFVAVQRGLDSCELLAPEELSELRRASASYRLRVPGAHDLAERPELVALGGVVFSLLGVGVGWAWLALLGIVLRTNVRLRAARSAASLRRTFGAPDRVTAIVDVLGRSFPVRWAGLVDWDEDGLGGSIRRTIGADGPSQADLMSWLIREAESGAEVIVAPGAQLGRDGIEIALPLRRDNSALVGFLVLEADRLPPRHLELALLETLDELGLAFADRPALDGGDAEDAEALQAGANGGALAVVGLDQR